MKIKHRYTQEVLLEIEATNLRGADLSGASLSEADLYRADLREANLSGANLSGADLRGAYLRGADLRGAYLCGANLREADLHGEKLKEAPLFIYGLAWDVLITNEFLTIGCQRHSHAEWEAFSNDQIAKMERRALRFWQEWKRPLLSMCSIHSKKEE